MAEKQQIETCVRGFPVRRMLAGTKLIRHAVISGWLLISWYSKKKTYEFEKIFWCFLFTSEFYSGVSGQEWKEVIRFSLKYWVNRSSDELSDLTDLTFVWNWYSNCWINVVLHVCWEVSVFWLFWKVMKIIAKVGSVFGKKWPLQTPFPSFFLCFSVLFSSKHKFKGECFDSCLGEIYKKEINTSVVFFLLFSFGSENANAIIIWLIPFFLKTMCSSDPFLSE